jgi:hypothetical protein
MGKIEERLAALGLALPPPAQPPPGVVLPFSFVRLVGDRALISNATGCSSIYGGNLPTTPYCTNTEGRGPSWSNSQAASRRVLASADFNDLRRQARSSSCGSSAEQSPPAKARLDAPGNRRATTMDTASTAH